MTLNNSYLSDWDIFDISYLNNFEYYKRFRDLRGERKAIFNKDAKFNAVCRDSIDIVVFSKTQSNIVKMFVKSWSPIIITHLSE